MFFSDPTRPTVIQRVTFETLEPGKTVKDYNVYLLNNPSINNTGSGGASTQCNSPASKGGDNSRTLSSGSRTFLVASEPDSTSSALTASIPWKNVDGSDGFTDLLSSKDQTMNWHYEGAFGGNVAQMGWLDFGNTTASSISFDVVLGFGKNESEAMDVANGTLNSDLVALEGTYTKEWEAYAKGLKDQGGLADDQYYLAAMTLKSIQDKTNGAMVAGPATPWGETNGDGNQGGYHLVWPRDLFKLIQLRQIKPLTTCLMYKCSPMAASHKTAMLMAASIGMERRWIKQPCQLSWLGN
jgi:glucoamylase